MKVALFLFTLVAGTVTTVAAQGAADLAWRQSMMGLPGAVNGRLTIAEVQQFQRNLSLAAPYFASLSPADFEANRVLIGRMWAYAVAMNALARDSSLDPALPRAIGSAYGAMSAIPYLAAYSSLYAQPPAPQQMLAPPPPPPGPPPFPLTAPAIEGVSAQDRELARELEERYDIAAAQAAAAWQNAETLRTSLVARGLTLNAQTSASVARLQLLLEQAWNGLKSKNWEEARLGLERAESETAKVFKTVGGR